MKSILSEDWEYLTGFLEALITKENNTQKIQEILERYR